MLCGWDYDNSDCIFSKCEKEIDITQYRQNTISYLHSDEKPSLCINTSSKNYNCNYNRSPSEIRKRFSSQIPTQSDVSTKKQLIFSRKNTLRSNTHIKEQSTDGYDIIGSKRTLVTIHNATFDNHRKIRQVSAIKKLSKNKLYKLPPLFLQRPIKINNLEVSNEYSLYTICKSNIDSKKGLHTSVHQRMLNCIQQNQRTLMHKEPSIEKVNKTANISALNKCTKLEEKLRRFIIGNAKL